MAERDLTFEEQHKLNKQMRKEASRSRKGRLQDREHLRLEIEARDIIGRMKASTMTLIQGFEEITTPVGDSIQQPLSRERIAAIRAAADIDKTLLDRVLPPLKPVEVERPPEMLTNPSTLTDNDLKQAVAEYLNIDQRLLPNYDPNNSSDDHDLH